MSSDSLIQEEGVTTWLYLDTADPPVVTTGCGDALFSIEECLALPWDQPEAQVRADYAAVLAAPRNYKASWYARLTKSRLPEAFVLEKKERDRAAEIALLKKTLPRYDEYPASAREALADMAYNLGGAFLAKWPRFRKAVIAENWPAAAATCHRRGIPESRNERTAALFRQAASSPA